MTQQNPIANASLFKLEYPQSVGVFNSYAEAQKAVDRLADNDFPVKNLAIVGTDLKLMERVTGRRDVHWSGPHRSAAALGVRRFDRLLDASWRRTSYSGLTAAAKEPGVASEPEERVGDGPQGDERQIGHHRVGQPLNRRF